jgi:hypothetical protein
VRRETCGPADDEQQLGRDCRVPEVVQNRRHRAVDVDRHRLDALRDSSLERPDERDAAAGLSETLRHPEQDDGAGIFAVHAMPDARQASLRLARLADHRFRDGLDRQPLALCPLEARLDDRQAGEAGAPVGIADREDPRRHGRFRCVAVP